MLGISTERRGTPFEIDNFKQKAKRAAKSASEGAGTRFLKTTPKSMRDYTNNVLSDLYDVRLD